MLWKELKHRGISSKTSFAAFGCPCGRNQLCFEALARKARRRCVSIPCECPVKGEQRFGGAAAAAHVGTTCQAQGWNLPGAFPSTCYLFGQPPVSPGGNGIPGQWRGHPNVSMERRCHPAKEDPQPWARRWQTGEAPCLWTDRRTLHHLHRCGLWHHLHTSSRKPCHQSPSVAVGVCNELFQLSEWTTSHIE